MKTLKVTTIDNKTAYPNGERFFLVVSAKNALYLAAILALLVRAIGSRQRYVAVLVEGLLEEGDQRNPASTYWGGQ